MRKALLFALFACFISIGMAQPILDQNGVGAVGSVYYLGTQDTLLPAGIVGSAGANQTWDMTMLVATSLDTLTYVTPASTGYAASFPTANLAIQQSSLNNGAGFLDVSSGGMDLQGFVGDLLGTGTPIVAYQTPSLRVSQFPFAYQDNFANTSILDVTLDASGFGIAFVDSARFKNIQVRNLVADGYGDLNLPGASYTNVMRIKEVNMQTDSTWIHTFFGWQLFSDSVYTDSTFSWSDNTKGYLLAQAEYVGGVLDNVSHQDFVLVGRVDAVDASYLVYPNPAQNRLIVRADAEVTTITISDLQGRAIASQPLNGTQTEVQVGELPRGLYLYRLLDVSGMPKQSGKLLLGN
jgi:Secretion system C-terminal sorting domain